MIGPEADEAVLACLRAGGPGTVTVKQVTAKAGVTRVTARAVSARPGQEARR